MVINRIDSCALPRLSLRIRRLDLKTGAMPFAGKGAITLNGPDRSPEVPSHETVHPEIGSGALGVLVFLRWKIGRAGGALRRLGQRS